MKEFNASMPRAARMVFVLMIAIGLLAGCSGKTVQRIDPGTVTDVSGTWNDTDSRLVSEEMISDVLGRPWLVRHEQANSERPTVIVGLVKNRSSEHIPVETFTKDMEREFVNSGAVGVVASPVERDQIRDERTDQQDFSRPDTVKQFGQENGADYMMLGTINAINDQEGGDKVVFYQINLELIDIQSNEKVWIGDKRIKKYIGKGKYKP